MARDVLVELKKIHKLLVEQKKHKWWYLLQWNACRCVPYKHQRSLQASRWKTYHFAGEETCRTHPGHRSRNRSGIPSSSDISCVQNSKIITRRQNPKNPAWPSLKKDVSSAWNLSERKLINTPAKHRPLIDGHCVSMVQNMKKKLKISYI